MTTDWLFSTAGIIVLVAVGLSLLVIALFFIVMHFISVAGLIGGVLQIEKKKITN